MNLFYKESKSKKKKKKKKHFFFGGGGGGGGLRKGWGRGKGLELVNYKESK